MFENFGLLDIWSALKRYRTLAALLLALCIIAGAIYGYRKADSHNQSLVTTYGESDFRVISTYGVTTKDAEDITKNQAMIYINLFKTQPSRDYIVNAINDHYYPGRLNELSSALGVSITDAVTYEDLQPSIQIARLTDTPVFAVIVQTHDERVALDISEAYQRYIQEVIPEEINNSYATFIDTTTESYRIDQTIPPVNGAGIYEGKDLDSSGKAVAAVSKKSSMIKYTLLFTVAGAVIAVLLAAVKALLQPTLNRKSDFAKYDVPVISEIETIGRIRSK